MKTVSKLNQKKITLITGIILLLLLVGGLIFVALKGSAPPPPTASATPEPVRKKRLSAPQNLLPLTQRPVVTLEPYLEGSGRFVRVIISEVRIAADRAEYEVVYNITGASAVGANGQKVKLPPGEQEGGLQAFQGELELTSLPVQSGGRFGTCSAGGACVNNNVDSGELVLNFDASEPYAVKSLWTYFENGLATSTVSGGAFSITAPELEKQTEYLILESSGLPTGLTETVVLVSDPESREGATKPLAYQINFSDSFTPTTASIEFAQQQPKQEVRVYNGETWLTPTDLKQVPLGNGYIYALVDSES